MKRSWEKILRESIAELEASGGDVERVLQRHPQHRDALRPHLEMWSRLSSSEQLEPSPAGFSRGLSRLSAALNTQNAGGARAMSFSRSGGLVLKVAGAAAIVAAIAIGIAFASGNLDVEVGDGGSAQADFNFACLDQVLGNLADPQDGKFTVDDLLAFRDAFRSQNTDPRYDRDGDGDVDIDDVMVYIQELRDCFGSQLPVP